MARAVLLEVPQDQQSRVTDVTAMPVRERIQALDVLRGVAVGGILLANILVFFGFPFMMKSGAPSNS